MQKYNSSETQQYGWLIAPSEVVKGFLIAK